MEINPMNKHLIILAVLSLLLTPTWLYAGINIDGTLTHERIAQPGETFRGVIAIRNTGQAAAEIKVYQTDYSFTADGSNDYGTPGKLPRSNASWLKLTQEQITIAPQSVVNVHYEVKVADDPTLNGTYWSMVMVEPVASREATLGARSGEISAQLTPVMRYGIQMVTHIGDDGTRELAFTNPQLLKKEGQRLFKVDVENTGERWLKPQLWLELYDGNGRPLGKFKGERHRIYPATSVRFQVNLGDIPAGRYHTLIVADSGGDDLFGSQIDINLQ